MLLATRETLLLGKMMELKFREFRRTDFSEYLSWFQDSELNKYLGPMHDNDEWLQEVLSEQPGSIDYSVLVGDTLVAVVGLYLPKADYPHFVLSNLAVKPLLRGQTIGKKVIEELIKRHSLLSGQSWLAFVDKENGSAWRLFTKCGWERVANVVTPNEMYLFEYI